MDPGTLMYNANYYRAPARKKTLATAGATTVATNADSAATAAAGPKGTPDELGADASSQTTRHLMPRLSRALAWVRRINSCTASISFRKIDTDSTDTPSGTPNETPRSQRGGEKHRATGWHPQPRLSEADSEDSVWV